MTTIRSPIPCCCCRMSRRSSPGLGLGTAVMVLPWYNPIRFAEDIAMLQTLKLGRAAYRDGARHREIRIRGVRDLDGDRPVAFRGSLESHRLALKGERFTFDGEFVKIADRSAASAAVEAVAKLLRRDRQPGQRGDHGDLDLPPLACPTSRIMC